MSSANSLTFLRNATKAKDGNDGLLYRHEWPTGYQELVFPSEDAAKRWLDAVNVPPIPATDVFAEARDYAKRNTDANDPV